MMNTAGQSLLWLFCRGASRIRGLGTRQGGLLAGSHQCLRRYGHHKACLNCSAVLVRLSGATSMAFFNYQGYGFGDLGVVLADGNKVSAAHGARPWRLRGPGWSGRHTAWLPVSKYPNVGLCGAYCSRGGITWRQSLRPRWYQPGCVTFGQTKINQKGLS
jgi:hypothetical protein